MIRQRKGAKLQQKKSPSQRSSASYCSNYIRKEWGVAVSDTVVFISVKENWSQVFSCFVVRASVCTKNRPSSISKRERKRLLRICVLWISKCAVMVQVLHCYVCLFVCLFVWCYIRLSGFHSRCCSDWWVLTLCSRISWRQCFGVTCWFCLIVWRNRVQGDTAVIGVRTWCNCVSRLQQMRAVSVVGRWEGLKEMVDGGVCTIAVAVGPDGRVCPVSPFWGSYWPHSLLHNCNTLSL